MRARNAGNSLCASCTVPVHTSCSGSLPGPSRACSSRLYSLVPTPVLLADVFSGVRIGEERRNVLTGEDSYWRDESIVGNAFSCQEYFCTFFRVAPVFVPLYAPFSLSFRPAAPSALMLFRQSLCVAAGFPYSLWALFCVPFLLLERPRPARSADLCRHPYQPGPGLKVSLLYF